MDDPARDRRRHRRARGLGPARGGDRARDDHARASSSGSTATSSGGIWECTPGPSYWTQDEHEVIHLVAGRMTVTRDGGEPVELGAGDMAVFPKGWSGTWDIHETVRKVYAIF